VSNDADRPSYVRRLGVPGIVVAIGSPISAALGFEPPVLGPVWTWIVLGIGALALILASISLVRGLKPGWNTVPQLILIAASLCLVLQPWIPQLRLAPFGIALLLFIGFAFS
jgi:hypothetical protein